MEFGQGIGVQYQFHFSSYQKETTDKLFLKFQKTVTFGAFFYRF